MYHPAAAESKRIFWCFVRIAFVISAVLLWSDEHDKVTQLLSKPQPPIVQVTLPPQLLGLLEKQVQPQRKSQTEGNGSGNTKNTGPNTFRANKTTPAPSAPFPIETVTFTQKSVPSDKPEYAYAVEAVVQTNTNIQPVSLMLSCSVEVEEITPRLPMMTEVAMGYITGHKELALLKSSFPALSPDKPLIVVLKSKQENKVLAVKRFEF